MATPKFQTDLRPAVGVLSLLFVLCVLPGCAPSLSEVQAFGGASKTLGTAATHALDLTDSSTVDRQIYNIAADRNSGPTADTFESLFEDKAESLRLRLALLDRLTRYAAALEALTSADLSTEVDRAATDLKAALSGLTGTLKQVTGNDLLADESLVSIAAAVDAIGSGAIEARKREAIRTIIIQADPAVQTSAALLEKELGKDSDLASFVEANLTNIQVQLQIAYNNERTRATSTFADRLAALKEIRAQSVAAKHAFSFFDDVSKGAGAMAKAHAALKTAVKANKFTSPDVVRSVNELISYAENVRDYYERLNAANSK